MSPSRVKWTSLLVCLVGGALALLAWTQPWFVLQVSGLSSGAEAGRIEVAGSEGAGALAALGLASLALVGAAAIAGPIIRVVLGLLQVVLGGCIVLGSVLPLADPVGASLAVVSQAIGVSGAEDVRAAVLESSATGWGALGVAGGVIAAVGGLLVVLTAGRWPRSGSRYAAVRMQRASAGDEAEPDRVVDWDALSAGDDPTDASPGGTTGDAGSR